MDNLGDIFVVLISALAGAGGLGGLAAVLKLFFDSRNLKVKYRQAINQKMIDRVSQLAELHYMHVSSSAIRLRVFLMQGLPVEQSTNGDRSYERGIFYSLTIYLHYVDELARERPLPLFKEFEAEEEYISAIANVYEGLPFGFYEVSSLVARIRRQDSVLPPHEFVQLIERDQELEALFESFYSWLTKCECGEAPSSDCNIHKVIEYCESIGEILVQQIRILYSEWYGA
jgi:hypothetical protein